MRRLRRNHRDKPWKFALEVSTTIPVPAQPGKTVTARLLIRSSTRPDVFAALSRFGFERVRVERFLAAISGIPIPILAVFRPTDRESLRRLSPLRYASGPTALTSSQMWELPSELPGLYDGVKRLLQSCPPDSLIGRALENAGQAALDTDPDLAYLHAWNAVELLAKSHHLGVRPGTAELKPDGTRKYLHAKDVVPPFVKSFFDGKYSVDAVRLESLRNSVAHGGRGLRPGSTYAEYLERAKKLEAVLDLARGTMFTFLSSQRLIPPVQRPFLPRIMIPSWRPGKLEIRSVDNSRAIAGRRPRRSGIRAPAPITIKARMPRRSASRSHD